MALVLGIIAFALCIGIALAIHEAAHMWTARMFGMKVRRYFIGFGPTIWSKRRGETEYGLKAIPAGGFCDIAGMTAMDELTPDERPRAMWRYPVWKRTVVMASGSISHFILGFVVIYVMAIVAGLPNFNREPVVGTVSACAPSTFVESPTAKEPPEARPCTAADPAPARDAGVQAGDEVVAVAGKPVSDWNAMAKQLQASEGPTPVQVERDGRLVNLNVDVARVPAVVGTEGNWRQTESGTIGVGMQGLFAYNPLTAVGGTLHLTGNIFTNVLHGLTKLPEKLPALVSAIGGGERDPETPVSVVGASRIGGEVAAAGLWQFFFFLVALVNFGLGVFNLLPLLPLDGGHIVVAWYERVRDWLRKLRGQAAGGPVDYTKLVPVTMVVMVIGASYMVVAILADVVNPITIPNLD